MDSNDFYGSEVSTILEKEDNFKISFVGKDGKETVLKASLPLEKEKLLMQLNFLQNLYKSSIKRN